MMNWSALLEMPKKYGHLWFYHFWALRWDTIAINTMALLRYLIWRAGRVVAALTRVSVKDLEPR
jgi:hypothetical protein